MVEIFLLSLIQGVTEFLPISSSSHLILMSKYLKFENQGLTLDVCLHVGSFAAVITFFREDIRNFIKNKDLFFKILIASIPVMVFGFFLVKSDLISQIRSIKVIGWTTLIFGIVLFLSDKSSLINKIDSKFTFKTAIIIGFFQVLSLIPGVSRSGITITAARILKFKRYDSAKISFLLSIPTLGAVSVFGIQSIINEGKFDFTIFNLIAIIFSFFFSYFTIKYFLKIIKKFDLYYFVLYRIILGTIILFIIYL